MKGHLAFDKWGDIDPMYVLEASPNHLLAATPAEKPKRPSFFSRHSGLVAALVCGVLAVGIYLGILLGQPDPSPLPPVGTDMESVVSETQPTTEGESEVETTKEEDILVSPLPENYANPYFVVEKVGGQSYLNFYNGAYDHGSGLLLQYLTFPDMDTLFDALYNGNMTEEHLTTIYNYFPRYVQGYPIFDIGEMYTPVIPDGGGFVSVEASFEGVSRISYVLAKDTAPVSMTIEAPIENNVQYSLSSALRKAEQEAYLSKQTMVIGDAEAVVYTRMADTEENPNADVRVVTVYWVYTFEDTQESIFVQYQSLQNQDGTTDKVDLYVEGFRRDCYFEAEQTLTNATEIAAFEQNKFGYLTVFDACPYEPPTMEAKPQLPPKQPYVVQEVDGITYIRFTDWDGILPDAYRPADTENLASLYFSSPQDVYDRIYNNGLSLYQQMLLKAYPQTEYGVALGDLSSLLVANIPENYQPIKYYYITPNEKIGAVSGWDDCLLDPSVYFETMSKEAWESQLASLTPQDGVEGMDHFIIRQGTFEGIPCTFYEYDEETPDYFENPPWVICRFTVGEGRMSKRLLGG